MEIAGGFEAGHREVHHQVIAAVTGTGTRDWAVKLGDEGEGLAHKRQYICTLQVSLDDEVIAGEAAHGSPIDYPFAPLAVVSQEGGGKVLYGVDRIWMEHRLPVGLLHPDIKGVTTSEPTRSFRETKIPRFNLKWSTVKLAIFCICFKNSNKFCQ